MKKRIRSRPSALQIAMLALAVLILLEGLFLLHLKSAAAKQGMKLNTVINQLLSEWEKSQTKEE